MKVTARRGEKSAGGATASKRATIMAAAGKLFLEQGYGATSMDAVTQAAMVSKATVYAHFPSKDALFGAIVRERCQAQFAPLVAPDMDALDPYEGLVVIGRRVGELMLAPEAQAIYRVVISEAPRFPELGQAFYRAGPEQGLDAIAGYLAECHRRGTLVIPDPLLAAELFSGMIRNPFYLRLLLGISERCDTIYLERLVEQAARIMVRSHAPPPAIS